MMSDPTTRASLLLRIRDPADREAWDRFASLYRPIVVNLARHRGMQMADAEDLAQLVLIAIINALTRVNPDRAGGGTDMLDILHDQPAPGPATDTAEMDYRRESFAVAAEQIRGEFADSTWQAFWQAVVENRPIDEVAAELGRSRGSVYTSRSRVMVRLKQKVQELDSKFSPFPFGVTIMKRLNKPYLSGFILFAAAGALVTPVTHADDTEKIQAEVRESFQANLDSLRVRVEKAESALEQIKDELKLRESRSDEMIAKRLAELVGEKMDVDEADVSAEILSSEGWKAWSKQDWRTAEVKFKKALDKDPKLAVAMHGLGWVQFNTGASEKVLATFEKTLELDSNMSGAMNGIGQALLALGRLDEAEARLTQATQELIKQYGEASVVAGGMTASWSGLVRTLLKKGDREKAAQWANRYLKHKPEDEMMKALLAETLTEPDR